MDHPSSSLSVIMPSAPLTVSIPIHPPAPTGAGAGSPLLPSSSALCVAAIGFLGVGVVGCAVEIFLGLGEKRRGRAFLEGASKKGGSFWVGDEQGAMPSSGEILPEQLTANSASEEQI